MRSSQFILGALLLALGCSGGSGSGVTGTYTAVDDTPLTMEFKSGGGFSMSLAGVGGSTGTYTVDGEKIIVSVDGQTHTFIRDGNCLEEGRQIFGKVCKGGKAGAASNVSTRSLPTTHSGTYVATNADGVFKLEFQPGNRLRLTATPTGGQPDVVEGTFTVEGDVLYATVGQSTPMVLKFVNNTYESTAFGLPMKFVKQ
jgi:hypothetical protein